MPESEAVSQVLQAEREWLLAHLNCDVAALDKLMADEYAQINSDGRVVGKAEVIASFESGGRHWDEAHSDELEVRVYGESAVVIGRWQARGLNTGQAFDYSARYVSVWIWRDDRWQMTIDQSTDIS
ncbi:MAG: nuclear transport factor 2 family protein [SAR202 cluster bacterium]|jgi:ketosteroid isomerase-like protein|nr:nuclear transport factor 2 family protein [SAR202 cluster bacterium]MDP6514350.1 nuclear transport factor 2 family protein [SAR202 cluster bacterium]MDP6714218.1 nuclear transport factor 2 family protein [SAR202 cluster bacterium]|tara:strand:+ start:128 stop:505 length:378 start_codon:yes stop_codon:yes gene_type:complete